MGTHSFYIVNFVFQHLVLVHEWNEIELAITKRIEKRNGFRHINGISIKLIDLKMEKFGKKKK